MSESLAEAAAREFGFNPNQARGFGGKWIKVGDLVKSQEHGVGKVTAKHADGNVSVRFEDPDSDTGDSVKKVAATTLAPQPKLKKLTQAQKAARERRLDDQDTF